MRYFLLCFLLIIIFHKSVLAIPPFQIFAPQRFTSSALGQGEAVVSNPYKKESLYYNPAGLSLQEHKDLEVFTPQLGFSSTLIKANSTIKSLNTSNQTNYTTNDINAAYNLLRPYEEGLYTLLGLNPYFIKKNFGIGLLVQNQIQISPYLLGTEFVELDLRADIELRVAGAFRLMEDQLAVGLSVAGINRYELSHMINVLDLNSIRSSAFLSQLKDETQQGVGVGVDLGFLFIPYGNKHAPKIGLNILNLGNTSFKALGKIKKELKVSDMPPSPIPMSISTGISFDPKIDRYSFLFLEGALEFHDINLPISAAKKLHVGLEGGYRGEYIKASLKAGYMYGGFSFGLELDLIGLHITFASYIFEQGILIEQKPMRRNMIEIKLLI